MPKLDCFFFFEKKNKQTDKPIDYISWLNLEPYVCNQKK